MREAFPAPSPAVPPKSSATSSPSACSACHAAEVCPSSVIQAWSVSETNRDGDVSFLVTLGDCMSAAFRAVKMQRQRAAVIQKVSPPGLGLRHVGTDDH